MNIDFYFFNLINNLAGKWVLIDWLAIFLAKYFEYFLLFSLVLFLVVNFRDYWKIVAESLIAAVLVRFFLVQIIKWFFFRPRPFVQNQVNLLINYSPNESSFPSGHASFYFALSTIIYNYNKRLGVIFYIVSFLIVLARVFVGIHWPSDILAGMAIGIFMGWLLSKIFKKLKYKPSHQSQ